MATPDQIPGDWPGAAIAAIYALWLIATLLYQMPGRCQEYIAARDPLALIPCWTFFAPNPGVSDYRLVFRDRLDDRWTEFAEVDTLPRATAARWLWNPGKLDHKIMSDAANALNLELARANGRLACLGLSWPYLLLLSLAMSAPAPGGAATRQFAVLATSGHTGPRPLKLMFLSFEHRHGPACCLETHSAARARGGRLQLG